MPPKAICTISPDRWGARFQLSGMVGRTLNICGELPEETVIDGKTFKEVVEGTIQSTEFKGRDLFDFKPIAANWFASNHLPRSRDTSMGFVRSEEHTSELQSLMRISYAVFCLKKKK